MMKFAEYVLDVICDLLGTDDYLEGYFGILFALLLFALTFTLISGYTENRKHTLALLRYDDPDRYIMIRRQRRARQVLVQKLILGVFLWPVIMIYYFIRWLLK